MKYEKLTSKDALQILAVSGLILSSFVAPNLVVAYDKLDKEWKKYKKGDIGKVIKRFHKQELLKISEEPNGQTVLEISNKGKSKLLKYDFDEIGIAPKRRDGKFRLFLFDIPEKHKISRDILRGKLKELGFIKVQESVFVTPYRCQDEIEFIIHYLQLANYCLLLQIGKIEIGDTLSFKSMHTFKLEQ